MNCRPGDLAIVIRFPLNRRNIGAIVTCDSICDAPRPASVASLGPLWHFTPAGRDVTVPIGPYGILETATHIPDDWLRPLPKDENVKNKVLDEVAKMM